MTFDIGSSGKLTNRCSQISKGIKAAASRAKEEKGAASAELTEELASLGTDLQETTVRTIVFVIKPNSIIVFS